VVVGVGVDHQGRAVGVQQPLAGAVLRQAGVAGEDLGVHGAGGVGEDVGQVAVIGAFSVQQAVGLLGIAVVDVGAGRGEGRLALARGVDVDAVPAGRQARGLDLDQQAGRALRQGRLADVGALTVDDGDLRGLARRSAHHGHVGGVLIRRMACMARMLLSRRGASGEGDRQNAGRDEGGWCQAHEFPVLLHAGISAAFLCHHGPLMIET
jgi:hypothetical protein